MNGGRVKDHIVGIVKGPPVAAQQLLRLKLHDIGTRWTQEALVDVGVLLPIACLVLRVRVLVLRMRNTQLFSHISTEPITQAKHMRKRKTKKRTIWISCMQWTWLQAATHLVTAHPQRQP